jgi:hypothetical protein
VNHRYPACFFVVFVLVVLGFELRGFTLVTQALYDLSRSAS